MKAATPDMSRSGGLARGASRLEAARRFLYDEADLLDAWRLEEWLELFADDCRYVVPSTDDPGGDPSRRLGLIDDDHTRLASRVERLLSRRAAREFPLSRTRRLISNVRLEVDDEAAISIRSSFIVHRFHRMETHQFVGRYRHDLRCDGNDWEIVTRRAELDHELLDPQGTVSIVV